MPESAVPGRDADYRVPRSVRLASWVGAALRGEVSPDDAIEAVTRDDTSHRVRASDGSDGSDGDIGLALLIGQWRTAGVRGVRVVLPVAGDVAGLPGPPSLNAAAVEAGEAVLTVGGPGSALVPLVSALGSSGTAVQWRTHEALTSRRTTQPSLAEANRELAQAMREATEVLAALDVARFDDAAAGALARLRSGAAARGARPRGDARAYAVLTLAVRVGATVALALTGPGGAVTAAEIRARAEAMRPLARASRQAVAAAANAPLESLPPEPSDAASRAELPWRSDGRRGQSSER